MAKSDGYDAHFTTDRMVAVSNLVKVPSSWALNTLFPRLVNTTEKYASVEIMKGNQKIAPWVMPCTPGVTVAPTPREVFAVEHGYIHMVKPICCDAPVTRPFGGQLLSNEMTPLERVNAHTLVETADLMAMRQRRLNQMAIEIAVTGKLILKGQQMPTSTIDFRRNANHNVTLLPAAQWTQPGVDPMSDIRAWAAMTKKNGASYGRNVMMDSATFQVFRSNGNVEKRFVNGGMVGVAGNSLTNNMPTDGMDDEGIFQGTIDGFSFYTLDGEYENDAGVLVPYLATGEVSVTGNVNGIRSFGVIRDEKASYGSQEYFLKSYYSEETGQRVLDLASAPMLIPTYIDATLLAKVL